MPVKKGVWHTMKTANGTEVRVQAMGDEHMHFMQAEDGTCYTVRDNMLVPANMEAMTKKAMQRRATVAKQQQRQMKAMRKLGGSGSAYIGTKKALVILVEFSGTSFREGHDQDKFYELLNTKGYTTSEGFRGSAHDYFWDQSAQQFNLWFDVVGPYALKRPYSYYGKNSPSNDPDADDANMYDFVKDAITAAQKDVKDASPYDWDGDGYADMVFFLYAGYGAADNYPYKSETIWPHMYTYSELGGSNLRLGGKLINTYACSNEIQSDENISGIGTFCHEFSHCLGFPDFYDTSYGGYVGTDEYDLMCGGGYLGNGFCPPSYTAYEKMVAGWQQPIELNENRNVESIKPFSEYGNSYIIYNQAHPDEFYIMENRQKTGWDKYIPGKGLVIYHADYDKEIWDWNMPNTVANYSYIGGPNNDHERFSIVKANNNKNNPAKFPYPYTSSNTTNNSLTNTTTPAATLYNRNTDNSKKLNASVLDITQNSDGTISFSFDNGVEPAEAIAPVDADPVYNAVEEEDPGRLITDDDDDPDPVVKEGDYVKVTDDSEIIIGREYALVNEENQMVAGELGTQYFSGIEAEFGKYSFSSDDVTTLCLGGEDGAYTLQLADGTYLTTEKSLELLTSDKPSNIWMIEKTSDGYVVKTADHGTIQFRMLYNSSRFLNYLTAHEPAVLYLKTTDMPNPVNAIRNISATSPQKVNIYSIDGRHLGSDLSSLRKGIYIVNGKKVVK